MKNHPKGVVGSTLLASCAFFALLSASNMAWAQNKNSVTAPVSATPAAGIPVQADSNEKIQEVVVTGSSIPVAPDKVAVSVTTLDADAVAKNGVSANILEVLRKAIPSFAGRSNAGNSNASNSNQNTAGGSQVQLHNLDTLVLINGRRVTTSGINGIGGKNFVDINQVPTAAIDHIEVLTDGSSSIYGSDAIGGVVNLILKQDYEGSEVGTRYGGASGDYSEQSGYFVTGKSIGGLNITAIGSISHTDPLYEKSRSFSSPLTGFVSQIPGAVGANGLNPGALLAPGLSSPAQNNPTGLLATAPSINSLIANGTYRAATPAGVSAGFDASQYQTLILQQDQKNLVMTFSSDLLENHKLTFFGDFLYARTSAFTQFLPVTTGVTLPARSPFNPLTTALNQVTFGDLGLTHQFYDESEGIRVTAGLRGDLGGGWNWETGFVHSSDELTQRQSNVIFSPNLASGIAGGYDANGNPTVGGAYARERSNFSNAGSFVIVPALDAAARAGGLSQASLANIYGTEVINASSQLNSFDAKIVGTLFQLPAGKPGVAFGGSVRQESLSASTDPNGYNTGPTAHQWIGGTFADPFSKSRLIDAAFGELRVPITSEHWNYPGVHALDLIGAVRGEHYSDAGYSLVPKYGFRWQPLDSQVTFRGTYSKSFTAPTLYAEYGPTDTRLVGTGVIQTAFGLAGLPFNGEDGNNPNLKPSRSQTQNLGVVVKPKWVKGLTLTADYNAIVQTGFPGGIGYTNILQSVDQLGAASPFAGNVAMGNFPGQAGSIPFTSPGQLSAYLKAGGLSASNNIYAIDQFRNLGGLHVRSYNIGAEYEYETEKYGTFNVATQGTLFSSFKFEALPGQKYFEYAGTVTNGGTGVQGTLPDYRFYTSVDWIYQNWDFTLANTYVSDVTDQGPGGIVYATSSTLKPQHVSHYTTWDLRLAFSGEGFSALGIDPDNKYIKGWNLAIGVNNVSDEMPPLATQAYTDTRADTSTYSPIGRLVYATASLKF